jgi:hypothetical protein
MCRESVFDDIDFDLIYRKLMVDLLYKDSFQSQHTIAFYLTIIFHHLHKDPKVAQQIQIVDDTKPKL